MVTMLEYQYETAVIPGVSTQVSYVFDWPIQTGDTLHAYLVFRRILEFRYPPAPDTPPWADDKALFNKALGTRVGVRVLFVINYYEAQKTATIKTLFRVVKDEEALIQVQVRAPSEGNSVLRRHHGDKDGAELLNMKLTNFLSDIAMSVMFAQVLYKCLLCNDDCGHMKNDGTGYATKISDVEAVYPGSDFDVVLPEEYHPYDSMEKSILIRTIVLVRSVMLVFQVDRTGFRDIILHIEARWKGIHNPEETAENQTPAKLSSAKSPEPDQDAINRELILSLIQRNSNRMQDISNKRPDESSPATRPPETPTSLDSPKPESVKKSKNKKRKKRKKKAHPATEAVVATEKASSSKIPELDLDAKDDPLCVSCDGSGCDNCEPPLVETTPAEPSERNSDKSYDFSCFFCKDTGCDQCKPRLGDTPPKSPEPNLDAKNDPPCGFCDGSGCDDCKPLLGDTPPKSPEPNLDAKDDPPCSSWSDSGRDHCEPLPTRAKSPLTLETDYPSAPEAERVLAREPENTLARTAERPSSRASDSDNRLGVSCAVCNDVGRGSSLSPTELARPPRFCIACFNRGCELCQAVPPPIHRIHRTL